MSYEFENDKNFNIAILFLLKIEGGYSNHKCDKGGATNYGITQNTYNSYRKRNGLEICSVTKISLEEAKNIYFKDYWCASGANKIKDIRIAIILFDSVVNHGLSGGKNLFVQSNGDVNKFLLLRRNKYKAIVAHNPSQKVFLKGWMNRIDSLQNYINSIPT